MSVWYGMVTTQKRRANPFCTMTAELGLSRLSWPSHPPAQWGRLKSLWKSRELLELLKCCYMLLHVATSFSSRHQTQARERYAFASILKFILCPFLSMPMQSNLFFNAKLYSSSSVNYQERRINGKLMQITWKSECAAYPENLILVIQYDSILILSLVKLQQPTQTAWEALVLSERKR